ncbi:MAG: hypothetical protein ACK4WK_05375, partial [Anaerolineae bacterium]
RPMGVLPSHIERAVEIARAYGATRLILFGSALEMPDQARDLDLACDGIRGWKLYELGGQAGGGIADASRPGAAISTDSIDTANRKNRAGANLTSPVVGPLLEGGPAALVEHYGLPHEAAYADACHLCYAARGVLRGRFPEVLVPGQMYGEGPGGC